MVLTFKFNMNKIIIISIVAFFAISCNSDDRIEVPKYNYQEIENLELTGVVESLYHQRAPSFHGMGIVSLDVVNSNLNHYDPIECQSNYLIRIKKSKAELYIATGTLQIGDTIKIDLSNESLTYNSSVKEEIIEFKPSIYDSSFFRYIERKGYQKL